MTNLFCRAKNHMSNLWVYGYPIRKILSDISVIKTYIASSECIDSVEDYITRVKPETIGWATGILDKELNMIYEGDIIEVNNGKRFVVIFRNGQFCSVAMEDYEKSKNDNYYFCPYTIYSDNSRIVGNIYDGCDD